MSLLDIEFPIIKGTAYGRKITKNKVEKWLCLKHDNAPDEWLYPIANIDYMVGEGWDFQALVIDDQAVLFPWGNNKFLFTVFEIDLSIDHEYFAKQMHQYSREEDKHFCVVVARDKKKSFVVIFSRNQESLSSDIRIAGMISGQIFNQFI